jgi:hypothetical protein
LSLGYAHFDIRQFFALSQKIGGAGGDRTLDLLTASQALSQLSYSPKNSVINFKLINHSIDQPYCQQQAP